MKHTASRLAAIAYLVSLRLVMGEATAKREAERKQKNWIGHSHGPKHGTPGAFGGPKRAGIKLARKMVRAAAVARKNSLAPRGGR